jgi:hypothetical protein
MPRFHPQDTSVYWIGSILTSTLLSAMAAAPASAALIEAWLTFDAEYISADWSYYCRSV